MWKNDDVLTSGESEKGTMSRPLEEECEMRGDEKSWKNRMPYHSV